MSEILNFIKRLAIGTNETNRFADSADVVLDHYNSVLKEDVSGSPTCADIERYFTYYTAYTKLTAILEASTGWTSKDIFPISFEAYKEKAIAIGWSFMRQSVGIEIKGWETPTTNQYGGWGESDEDMDTNDGVDDERCWECGNTFENCTCDEDNSGW